MSNFAELSSGGGDAKFFVRWRGTREGPYPASVIEAKLAANEIGLLHEIFYNDRWVTIRDYMVEKEAALQAERHAREERERRAHEDAERLAKEREEKPAEENKITSAITQGHHRDELLQKAVMAAIKPKRPNWPWICLAICVFLWISSAAWESEIDQEMIHLAGTCKELSVTMQSSQYRNEVELQAFSLALIGEDPNGALDDAIATVEAVNSEAEQLLAEKRDAHSATVFWLIASLTFTAISIWRHVLYAKYLRTLGY